MKNYDQLRHERLLRMLPEFAALVEAIENNYYTKQDYFSIGDKFYIASSFTLNMKLTLKLRVFLMDYRWVNKIPLDFVESLSGLQITILEPT